MEKAVNFLCSVKENDEIVIIFNNDGDGICACVMMIKFLEEKMKIKKEPYIISQPMPMDKNLINRVKTTIPRKIILLDLAADQQPNIINRLKGLADVMVIDHHRYIKNLNAENVVHVNPRFSKSDIYQSTSYLVYNLCSKLYDMKKYLWIAAVGMVSDYDLSGSKDVLKEIRETYSIEKDDLYDTIFGRLADMISANSATKQITPEHVVFEMKKYETPEDFLSDEKLSKVYNEIEDEIKKIMEDAEKNTEEIGNFVFYNIKSRHSLRSPISTKLSEKYKGKIVVVYQRVGSKIKVSIRNQSGKKDLTKMLKKAIKGLAASAGGHEKAAGAVLNAKDWDVFKERFME